MPYTVKVGDIIRVEEQLLKVDKYLPTTDRVRLIPVRQRRGGRSGHNEYFNSGTPRWFSREKLKDRATFVESFEYQNAGE